MCCVPAGIATVLTAILTAPSVQAGPETRPATVDQKHSGLATGALLHATLTDLPKDVLLRAGDVMIGRKDLDAEIARAPEPLRAQWRKNAFYLLERMATPKLLLSEARAASAGTTGEPRGRSDRDILNQHVERIAGRAKVTEEQVKAFYGKNKALFGGASLQHVASQIRVHLLRQKRQEVVRQHIRALGRRTNVQVASSWAARQAVLAKDNPVDKARSSGRPSLIDFGADGCVPCDMMAPILEALKKKHAKKLNVRFIHVRKQQILAARYGIRSIPVQIFYDKDGREVFRHVGFFARDAIESKLAEMGVR
jgi:thiol-disulfide isomerase/thioredoxin